MSRKLTVSILILLGFCSGAGGGWSQFLLDNSPRRPEFGGILEASFASQYIWRGLEYNPKTVFQPGLRFQQNVLELEVKGNLDVTDSNDQRGKFTEWNYRAGLAQRGQAADFALSYIYYQYPEDDRDKTQELALETFWGYPAMLGFELYWDFDQADGLYWKTSTAYVWKIGILSIIPEVAIGFANKKYQRYYFNVSHNSFLDFTASLKLDLEFVDGLSLVAEGLYYELVRSSLRNSRQGLVRGEHFWGRGSLILRF
jgi:hypothetical protein